MGKNIYEMLNDVKINEDEYERMELTEFDKAQKQKRILKKIKKNNKSGKNIRKAALAAAAACAVVIGAAGAANPAMAKDLFSSTIGKLIENRQGTKDEKETKIYEKIAEGSLTAQEETAKHQDKNYNTSADVNGVNVSISDIYCDGYIVYYTAVLKTDNEELNQADFISAGKGSDTVTVNGIEPGGVRMSFEKASDGTFVKSGEIDLMDIGKDTDEESFADEDTLEVECAMENLIGYKDDKWDENGEYMSTGKVDGEWKMSFPVTVDRSANVTYQINKEDNGVKVCDVVKTKAGLVLTVETPDFAKKPYNDPYNDPDLAVVDTDGNCLQWLYGGIYKQNDDGTAIYKIMVLYENQTDLTFEVTNKNVNDKKIASIDFEIQ